MSETPAAKPPEEPKGPGLCGQFLKDHGIATNRLPDSCGVETIEIDGAHLEAAMKLLRGSSEIKLDYLVAVSGVDSADTFDSVYQLWSYTNNNELIIKVRVKKNRCCRRTIATRSFSFALLERSQLARTRNLRSCWNSLLRPSIFKTYSQRLGLGRSSIAPRLQAAG